MLARRDEAGVREMQGRCRGDMGRFRRDEAGAAKVPSHDPNPDLTLTLTLTLTLILTLPLALTLTLTRCC